MNDVGLQHGLLVYLQVGRRRFAVVITVLLFAVFGLNMSCGTRYSKARNTFKASHLNLDLGLV